MVLHAAVVWVLVLGAGRREQVRPSAEQSVALVFASPEAASTVSPEAAGSAASTELAALASATPERPEGGLVELAPPVAQTPVPVTEPVPPLAQPAASVEQAPRAAVAERPALRERAASPAVADTLPGLGAEPPPPPPDGISPRPAEETPAVAEQAVVPPETPHPPLTPRVQAPPVRERARATVARPRVAERTLGQVRASSPVIGAAASNEARPAEAAANQPGAAVAEAPAAGDWQRSLSVWLASHKTYPDEARRRGAEGSVVLRFTADRSGRVLDVALVRGSDSAVLDAAAEALLRNAALPPFTAGMPQETVTVTVRIRYALTN